MKREAKIRHAIVSKIRQAVNENKDKVYQEIRETKELYELMLKWSQGANLTDDEKAAVKSQLIDICKTIPALAIFMVPFGSVLLMLLLKYLPFNILPTAFDEETPE